MAAALVAGCDISHHQDDDDAIRKLVATMSFVVVKASEGMANDNPKHPNDPAHDRQVAIVRDAGKDCGHYHFAIHSDRPEDEADNFLALALAEPGDNLALDMERGFDGSWKKRGAYALAWLSHVEEQTGVKAYWYVDKTFHKNLLRVNPDLSEYPLWIAAPSDKKGKPAVTGWSIHQYSSAGGFDRDVLAPDVSWTDHAIPGEDMPLTHDDAELVARTLASSREFKNEVARFVWEGNGGDAAGVPSFQNQVKAIVTSAVGAHRAATPPPLSESDVERIADAVVAKLARSPAGRSTGPQP
jgi:hypothetical protein